MSVEFLKTIANLTEQESAELFFSQYIISQGEAPQDDYTIRTVVYRIPMKTFNNMNDAIGKANFKEGWSVERKEVNLFKPFYVRIPVYSAYDCTGQLCSVAQTVFINRDSSYWYVTVIREFHFDL